METPAGSQRVSLFVSDQEVHPGVEEKVVSGLEKEFLLAYEEVVFSSCSSLLPEPWVCLGLRSSSTQLWFICPSPEDTPLSALIQTKVELTLNPCLCVCVCVILK